MLSEHEPLSGLPNNLGQLVGRARRLSLVDWTAHEFELVVYPEANVFRRGGKGLCPYLSDRQHTLLRIYDQPAFNRIGQTYQDFPLCAAESN